MVLLCDTALRQFPIDDILTITTGVLISPRRLEGVYDILSYMADDDLDGIMAHLFQISELAEQTLLNRYPMLKLANDEARSGLALIDQMMIWTARYGDSLAVPQLSVWEIMCAMTVPS